MTAEYETITHALLVLPKGQPIFSEMATLVELCDEAAGPFVTVTQSGRTDLGKIAIGHEEWPAIRDAIEQMMAFCAERPA